MLRPNIGSMLVQLFLTLKKVYRALSFMPVKTAAVQATHTTSIQKHG